MGRATSPSRTDSAPCAVPGVRAERLFSDIGDSCQVKRQPATGAELEDMLWTLWAREFDGIRYRGSDPALVNELQARGLEDLIDGDDEGAIAV